MTASTQRFPHLFSPCTLGAVEVRNRIVSTAHHTHLATDVPTERLVAYHEARARGGAGLIVVEVAGVHASARFASHLIMADTDACAPGYRAIAEACHRHGCAVFGQLFHPGRETRGKVDGVTPVAWAPSALPGERHHVMPREMPAAMIREVAQAYATAAARLVSAGLDGIEILASQGYLLAQFLSPQVNRRGDAYGGSFDNRLRIVREIVDAIRTRAGGVALGIRLSADARSPEGADAQEMAAVCRALDTDGGLDYFSLVLGSASTLGGSTHIVPPMEMESAYVVPFTEPVKAAVTRPVMIAGRINQPQVAERLIAERKADLCGMTRALITDCEMPNKARAGALEDIRACIGCNQACTGHGLLGFSVSCIQRPESGRELEFGIRPKAAHPRRILVAGAGPAGLKAAAVAAERGHRVTLYERGPQPGGQVLLASRLPSRAEFGGLITNLLRECQCAGVQIVTRSELSADLVRRDGADAVIVATGALPYVPDLPGAEEAHVVTAWQVLRGEANVGASVVIADLRSDWIGLGLAEMLARAGSRVRLCVNGTHAGETLQLYVRDALVGRAHRAGVEIIPYLRLYGVDEDTVYLQHTASEEPVLCEGTDTLVLALGHRSVDALEAELAGGEAQVLLAGDCLAPRTAEEAVYEGMKAGLAV